MTNSLHPSPSSMQVELLSLGLFSLSHLTQDFTLITL